MADASQTDLSSLFEQLPIGAYRVRLDGIMLRANKDRDVVSAACNDYLMYSGYAMMGYFWLKQAIVAQEKLAKGGKDSPEFYKAKLQTAEFYFERMLPRADGHFQCMMATSNSTMQMDKDHFTMV